jgi:hypothetical protein
LDPFSHEATGGFEWNNDGILTGHGITAPPPVKVIPFGWRKRVNWMNSLRLVVGDISVCPDIDPSGAVHVITRPIESPVKQRVQNSGPFWHVSAEVHW